MGTTPSGYHTEYRGPYLVTNAAWVALPNPNKALGIMLTASQNIYVRFEQPQPAVGDVGFRVWAQTYFNHTNSSHALGYDPLSDLPIPNIGPVWVRAVGANASVDANWFRE